TLRGHRQPSLELAEEIDRLAQGGSDEVSFAARSVRGITAYWGGAQEEARLALEQAIAIYRPDLHPIIAQSFGDEAFLLPNYYHFLVLWYRGRPDEAVRKMEETRQIVRGLSSSYLRATFSHFEMILWRQLRRADEVRRVAEQNMTFSREQRF